MYNAKAYSATGATSSLALAAIAITVLLCVATSAQTNRTVNGSATDAAAQNNKTLNITRGNAPPPPMRESDNFTGSVGVERLQEPTAPAHLAVGRVTFAPGARTAWHSHPLGQTLIVTAGIGWVQQEGGEKQEIRPGDVVWTPPGVKHWHGATATDRLTHIALTEQQPDGKRVEWMEKVSDAQYNAPLRAQAVASTAPNSGATPQPRPSQRAIGDFSPKLAQLTDDVLYADVWERPQLAKRDRSLVTVAALIAMNRPDQLRSHFARARDNGVTQEELIETITHMAFYAGWPSAITAIAVAREVFEKK